MARQIRSTQEAVAAVVQPTSAPTSGAAHAVFTDNLSREHKFADGTKFLFVGTQAVVTNPALIANLKALAAKPGSKVFLKSESESTQPAEETAEAQ